MKKNQANFEQYSIRSNVEFSNISNVIPDNQFKSKVIQICHESSVAVDDNDIEGYRLSSPPCFKI